MLKGFHLFSAFITLIFKYWHLGSPYFELKKLTTLNKNPPTIAGKKPGTVILSGKKCPINKSTTAFKISPAVPRDK
jgi:hypothetical protein